MPIAAVCMSHSPLLEFANPPAEVRASVDEAFARAQAFVKDFDPELVVTFGPDHYNGFFYDLMPPFCVCFDAVGVGDYESHEGPLNCATELAQEMTQAILDADVDVTISRRAELDHGAVQPLEILFEGDANKVPTIPVFVNGLARPFAPMKRVRLLGEAIGTFLQNRHERILLIGSGGLSHDPPVPQWVTATEQQRQFLLAGRQPTPEAREARQQNTINTGAAFARGEATIQDLNPEWDKKFMELAASGDVERYDDYTADAMEEAAGHSVHEVRTWVAATSALKAAAGSYEAGYQFYRPIKEYIAGFGVMTFMGGQP
ncbi:3-carboxyethylcatechol 2,3-dioxygenase [Mariniluteicoccus endophyticus]